MLSAAQVPEAAAAFLEVVASFSNFLYRSLGNIARVLATTSGTIAAFSGHVVVANLVNLDGRRVTGRANRAMTTATRSDASSRFSRSCTFGSRSSSSSGEIFSRVPLSRFLVTSFTLLFHTRYTRFTRFARGTFLALTTLARAVIIFTVLEAATIAKLTFASFSEVEAWTRFRIRDGLASGVTILALLSVATRTIVAESTANFFDFGHNLKIMV
jgi:hypothetical protein